MTDEVNALNDVACIVVHHNNFALLTETVSALGASGIPNERILIVDNSTDNSASEAVSALTSQGFPLLFTPNRGYAAAVNHGLAFLKGRSLAQAFTLVASHEALASPNAVRALRDELLADDTIGVVGPTLMDADSDIERIWSVGGRLTPILKLPRHHVKYDFGMAAPSPSAVDRAWLDGAFTLYRTPLLDKYRLDESYFLYFEETDLHTRLVRSGHRVVWIPRARVSQRSSGIPPRLLGRNLFIFHGKLFSRARGRFAVSFMLIHAFARTALKGRGKWSDVRSIASGWRAGEIVVNEALIARQNRAR